MRSSEAGVRVDGDGPPVVVVERRCSSLAPFSLVERPTPGWLYSSWLSSRLEAVTPEVSSELCTGSSIAESGGTAGLVWCVDAGNTAKFFRLLKI